MRDRLRDLVSRHGDLLLAAGLTALILAQIWNVDASGNARAVASAYAIGLGGALAVRTRLPLLLPVSLIAGGLLGSGGTDAFNDLESIGIALVLAIYSAAAHTTGRQAILAGVLVIALAVGAAVGDPEALNLSAVVFFGLVTGAPWLAGRVVGRRRLNELRLEREKAAAEAAIEEERSRIARELHDVVAHAISVIVLQARGARKLLDSDPELTRSALDTIERTSTQAMTEMRRLLGVLRADESVPLAPQPSLTQLGSLVAQVEAAGLPIELETEGDPFGLPPAVDLSAYRIVQEALTNALKHAGPARAKVVVRYMPRAVELEVTDNGPGTGEAEGTGHGLVGIRERVAVFDGEVEAGPQTEGGYAVRVRLPYRPTR